MKSKATIFVLVLGFFAAIWILWLGLVHKHNEPLNLLHALGSGNVEEVRQLLQLNPKLVNQNTLFNIPPLFEAVEEGKDEIAELLVENHAEINAHAHSSWGKTALHMAAQKSDVKMVEFLLEHKADVNARDDNGFTPLMDAIRSAEVMKLLLAHGADINAIGHNGANTAFSQVIENPVVAGPGVLQLLLDNGVDVTVSGPGCLEQLALSRGDTETMKLLVPYYGHFKNSAARSLLVKVLGEAMDYNRPKMASAMVTSCLGLETKPLHRAAISGDEAAVLSILGAHPDAVIEQDNFGWTPLHLAAMADQPVAAEALLSHQANRDAQDELGHTALCWAAYLGHDKVVEVLLRHKANMNLVGGQLSTPVISDWNSPLDFAIQQGFTPIALRLIANGAEINSTNGIAATPLHFAAIAGNTEIIAALLAHGAKIVARISSEKQTPLDYAVGGDSPESVRLLIANGASLHTETYAADGGNLFHLWASKSWNSNANPAVADQLLAAGCAVNGKDSDGKSPLHVAVVSRLEQAIQWLLDHQAEINAKDQHGLTPLHYAAQQCDPKAVQLLLDHQADANAMDDNGSTPLGLLREGYSRRVGGGPSPPSGYPNVVKLLLSHGAREP
jgi:ankyrin repeat protein